MLTPWEVLMARKFRDPEAPEVLQAVLQHIKGMTNEELLAEMASRPKGARTTWRTKTANCVRDGVAMRGKCAASRSTHSAASALAASGKRSKR